MILAVHAFLQCYTLSCLHLESDSGRGIQTLDLAPNTRAVGARFRRMFAELEQYAAVRHGAAVWRLQPLFCPPDATDDHIAAAQQARVE